MPLNELAVPERVVGEREVKRALGRGILQKLFVADDCDINKVDPLVKKAREMGVEVEKVDSKLKLGRACAIDRSAAVAGIARRL